MKKLTVLVTGVGGGGHGLQILKALRMSEMKYKIIGADMSPYSKGLLEADLSILLPPASDSAYIGEVLKVCLKYDVVALFHGSEPELKVMSVNRQTLQSQGLLLPINPSRVIELCMDKVKTLEFLRNSGFYVPNFKKVRTLSDLTEFETLPAVLKPSVGSGGSANTFIAQTEEDLMCFGQHLLSICPEFIVQEYVGRPESEFTVGVLMSMEGEFINSIAVKRNILSSLSNRLKVENRTTNKSLGPVLAISNGISQGEIGRFPEVTQQCEEIAGMLRARGALNIQCRLVGDRVYVFEINPRFSGTTSLRAMAGFNEPDVLIRRHVLHEIIETRFAYRSGVILRGLSEVFVDSQNLPGGSE
jgi:carbamoyl-phosphate synthase large subunit